MKKILMMFAVASLIFSCADEDLAPIVTFENLGKGAYIRLLSIDGNNLVDPTNIAGSSVAATVDFVDVTDGSSVAEYSISVEFDDNSPQNGDDSQPKKVIRSFTPSDFSTGGRGNVGISWSIPAQELLDFFGLTVGDLVSGDRFRFASQITTTSGSVHTFDNSAAPVRGAAFAGYFNFDAPVTCPLPDDKFSGSYTMSYEGDASGGYGLPFKEGDYQLTIVSSTKRKFTALALPDLGGFGNSEIVVEIICDVAVIENVTIGATCGSGNIIVGPGDAAPIISLTDDSVIKLNIVDYKEDGGCGVDPIDKVMILTKK